MKHARIFNWLTAWLTVLLVRTAAAAEPVLSVQVEPREVYQGDAFTLVVTLDSASPGGAAPVFADAFAARVAGGEPRSQSSRSISIINGRRTEHVVERTSWVYAVTPEAAGVFEMGGVTLTAGRRTLEARIPSVRVVGPEPQPYVSVSLTASRPSVLLEETFDVDVRIRVLRLGGEYAGHHPLPDGRQTPVHVEVPFFADGALTGAEPTQPLDQTLRALLERREGTAPFRINDFSVDAGASMFAFFAERRAAVFHLAREAEEWEGRSVWTYRLRVPMRATAEGVSRFGPVRFKGSVYAEREGEIREIPVFAVSDPLDVRVTPPPEAGRPDTFIGSLGTRMSAAVTLDTQTCRLGDPLELVLEIAGDQTRGNMRVPQLFDQPKLAERFRQYGEVGATRTPTGMRYTYRVRPIVSGTIEVPALELAFYNTEARAYERVWTAPVPLRVDPAPEIDVDSILGLPGGGAVSSLAVRRARALAGLTVSDRALRPSPQTGRLPVVAAFWVPPAGVFLLLGAGWIWRRRRIVRLVVRRRSAVSRSVRRVLRARTPEAVMQAVGVLLRDQAGETGAGFTPADVRRILTARGVDSATCDAIGEVLDRVVDAAFQPGADAEAVVRAHRMRLAGLLAGLRLSLLVWVAAGAVVPAQAGPERARAFVWRQAHAEVASARTPEEFLAVARLYREVLDGGAVSGEVLYNYGTVLVLAGFPALAVDAFERAEALDGAWLELENNLEYARHAERRAAAVGAEAEFLAVTDVSALPWYRILLSWHYRTPLAARLDVLLAVWGALGLGVLMQAAGWRRAGRACVAAALLGLAVFGSSVLASRRVLNRPMPPVPDQVADAAERTVEP